MNSSGWLSVSVRLALALAIGLVIGSIFHEPWAGLAVVLGLYLVLQLMNLLRMLRWLRADQMALAPDLSGPWGELVAMVARLYRRKQFHKQRLLRLLRELRRSTAAPRSRRGAAQRDRTTTLWLKWRNSTSTA